MAKRHRKRQRKRERAARKAMVVVVVAMYLAIVDHRTATLALRFAEMAG